MRFRVAALILVLGSFAVRAEDDPCASVNSKFATLKNSFALASDPDPNRKRATMKDVQAIMGAPSGVEYTSSDYTARFETPTCVGRVGFTRSGFVWELSARPTARVASEQTARVELEQRIASLQAEDLALHKQIAALQELRAAMTGAPVPVSITSPAGAAAGSSTIPAAVPLLASGEGDRSRDSQAASSQQTNGVATAGTTATGKTIYVGPRGGMYHYSASGKKVYEKRRK